MQIYLTKYVITCREGFELLMVTGETQTNDWEEIWRKKKQNKTKTRVRISQDILLKVKC